MFGIADIIKVVWKAFQDLRSENEPRVIEVHLQVHFHNHYEKQSQTKGHEVRQPPQRKVTGSCRCRTASTAGRCRCTTTTMQQLATTTTTDGPLGNATMQYHDHCARRRPTKGHEIRHLYHGVPRQPQPQPQVRQQQLMETMMQQLAATTTTDRPLGNTTMQYHDHCERQRQMKLMKWHEARRFHHGVPQQPQRQVDGCCRCTTTALMASRCHWTTTATAGTPTATTMTMQQLATTVTDRPLGYATMQQLATTITDRPLGNATMQQLATTITDRPLGSATMQYHDHYERQRQTKGYEVRHFHHSILRQPQQQVAAVVTPTATQRQSAAAVRQPQRQRRCNS